LIRKFETESHNTSGIAAGGGFVFMAAQVVGNLIFDVAHKGRLCKANFEEGWWQ
jgi:hypothetical protein